MNLFEVLPELVHDMEASLVRLGRGKVADQLRALEPVGWRYDDFAQSTYIAFVEDADPSAVGEVVSLADDIGVSIDLDGAGRVMGIDVAGYEEFLARLGEPGP
ncbi:MAG: hypothetical protein ACXWGT_01255 [Usitatibacter sp.]